MPITDPVSSISGRNSRASNVSVVTGASRSIRSHPAAQVPNDTLSSAGVLSMLKTTTDTGDIGSLSFNSSRLPTMPRATHQKKGHNPRLSGSNHHYAPSQASRVSSSREWDSMSNQRRGSLTSMQSMPPSLPPVHLGKGPTQMPPPPAENARESRSFSLTSAPQVQSLPRHRSAASLKSQGHEQKNARFQPFPGHGPPPMRDNRPPFVYPTRLKRPGYRSVSPALSDTYAQAPPPLPPGPPMGRRMPMPPRPPPPQTYNSDYGPDYNADPRYLNVRPPPRTMPNAPVMGYNEPPPGQYPYRNPAAVRSAPGFSMPQHHPGPSTHPHSTPPIPPHLHCPPPPPPHSRAYGHQPPPMMHRPPYPGAPYPPRTGYPGYPSMPYQGHHQPPPPPPNVAPMAHQMFHHAARMARQLPLRTDTPMTDGGPPSSDPPSSGTAATSSSPPTPKDHTTIQVAVDPAFIDPALVDLPDSSSEPVLAHQYLRYAEGLEKDVEDIEIEAAHPSIPTAGFVQRVKAMLESKAAAEAAAQRDADRDQVSYPQQPAHNEVAVIDHEDDYELHELAANETPRFTLIEEYEAPVELPASPVRLAELPDSPVQPERRITRELVKAELGPSSVDNTIDKTDFGETNSGETERLDFVVNSAARQARRLADDSDGEPQNEAVGGDEPSTPAQGAGTSNSEDAGSESTSSPVALGLSVVDYAMRFDSTVTSDETQSKDPFILDADTITLQHQRSRENVTKSEKPHKPAQPAVHEPQTDREVPVSPVLTGEDVSRCSAVSPLHTQTLGIDETLRAASEPIEDGDTSSDEHTVPGAYPEESLPPPTPKTPKTHSKSLQLRPSTASTETDTPSSNRYSLPADLSTVGETTMNDSTDMITDVAVRFSLPQTTVTVSRPQIIEIPPSSSPVRENPTPQQMKPTMNAADGKSKRSSVTFADEIAPLKINKKLEPQPASQKSSDSRVNAGKSIVRRVSPLQESLDPSRMSRDSTTDLRFSGLNGINNRFGSTHLPGLKEESIEEMSISDKHKSDFSGSFQFPLPARIAAVKAMQERRLQESAEKAKARRTRRHPNRPLAETRDLPSLNFSRMDLIDKLNEALEVRSSKSMDVIRRREFSGIYSPSPQRPQSTEPLRERYTSFFSKPEDFSSFLDNYNEVEDEVEPENESKDEHAALQRDVPAVEIQESTELELVRANSRPLSPEDFMSVANQVNRLSIPSVTGLSDRLSEILPNLRDLQLDSVLANFGEITEDIRRLGNDVRPETVLSTRTSAGFRSLAQRAEEIVNHGTHDSTVPIAKLLATNKDLPALPESMSADQVSAVVSVDGKQSYLSGSVSAPSELGKDVARPPSALTRQKSPTSEDEVQSMLPPEMNPIARNSKRAMIISSSSTRPWNQDENYPWAGTKVDIDLTVPSQAHTRKSIASEILHERRTKSLELPSNGEPTESTKGIDIGSIYEQNPTASLTSVQLTGVSGHHTQRKPSKRSVIGSITKKMGLGSPCNGNTTRNIPTPSDIGRSGSTLPHRPGERYPTSGLTPPAAFNLDEVRSFFSDDSSEKERSASFRKRLTKLKTKKSIRLEPPRPRGHSMENDTAYDAGQVSLERAGAISSAHSIHGVGMSKTEFRIKRFGEQLRHLMAKGGELIRSLSQRSKPPRNERVRDDWLSDSLYSGV